MTLLATITSVGVCGMGAPLFSSVSGLCSANLGFLYLVLSKECEQAQNQRYNRSEVISNWTDRE